MIDRVRERVAVSGAAPRVHVEHHIAVGREVLEHVAEAHVVHRERPAVNLENERILLGRLERGGLDDPALHARPAARPVRDLVDRREPLVPHHVVVHLRETRRGLRLSQVDADHVRRMLWIAPHPHRHEGARQGRQGHDLRARGDVAHAAGKVGVVHVDRAAIASLEVDALAVRRPAQFLGIAVEGFGDVAHPPAVDPHHVEIGRSMRVPGRIVAGECDAPPIRRHGRVRPIARPGNEGPNRATRDVQRVEARHVVLTIPGRVAQAVEHDRAPVRGPIVARPEPQAVEPGPHVPVPAGELPCGAAVRRHEEEMREALRHVAHTVLAIMQIIHHPGRGRPLRAFGRLRHRDRPERRIRHEHGKGDRLTVRRPARIGRRLGHAGHLR